MSEIRSASANTAVMSCSTSTIGKRPFSARSTAISRCASSWPVPAIGSASSNSFGSIAAAIATSSARFATCDSSPGITSSVTPSVTRRPPNFLLTYTTRSTASATELPPQLLHDADQPAAGKHRDEHEQRPEDDLPVLGDTREPFLGEQERGCAKDRAVERAHAAEDHHDQQFAGALPRHVGGTDEIGRVGEQETRATGKHAAD